jgi:hypothetical protein
MTGHFTFHFYLVPPDFENRALAIHLVGVT